MDVFDLVAKLTLDSSEYESGLGKAKRIIGPAIGGAIRTAAKIGVAALAAATTATVAVGTAAVKAGKEYESAFAQVKTIMDTNVMSTDEMSESLIALSNSMGVSASELSGTVYNAISATGDTANAVELAAQASKLAIAGFTDTSSALSVLTTAMNSYGLSAEEASSISDSLIKTQNLGVTTVAELASAMGKGIASASAYGVDLANLESAYISLTKNGINTAESTTYIASMMKELGDSGTNVAKIIQAETGKSFGQLMADGNSLADVLGILENSVDGDREALMGLWSSAEAGKASNAIVSQGLETFNENLIELGNSAGTTESAFETMQNTLGNKVSKFKTIGTNMLNSIYQGMSGELGGVVDFGITSMQTLFDAMQESGIDGVIDAFGSILSEGLTMITKGLPKFIKAGATLIKSLSKGLSQNMPAIVDAGVEIVIAFAQGLAESLPYIVEGAITLLSTLVQKLSDPQGFGEFMDAALKIVGALAKGIIQAIPLILVAAFTLFAQLGAYIVGKIAPFIQRGKEIVSNLVKGILAKAGEFLSSIGSLISDAISAIAGKLSEFLTKGKEIVSKLISGIGQKIAEAKAKAREVINGVKSAIEEKVGEFTSIGSNIISGLINGMTGMLGSVIAKAKDIIRSIKEAMTGEAEIESPSKLFAREVGKWIPAGVAEGMDNNLDSVEKSARNIIDVTESMFDAVEANKVKVHDALGEVVDFAPFINTAKSAQENAGFIQQNTINIYTQKGQSGEEIATEVQKVLVRWDKQRKAAGVA